MGNHNLLPQVKVKWTEFASASFMENVYNTYPEANSSDFDKQYEGIVISTCNPPLFSFKPAYLVVACNDGKIREVCIKDVEYING